MSKPLLTKKNSVLLICFVLIIVSSGLYCFNKFYLEKRPLSYIQAIDKVYNSNLDGMSVLICKSTNLHGSDARPYNTAAGNRKDNFSANSRDGVTLWSAKQIFLSAKTLKVLRSGSPDILSPKENDFYVIQTFQDYYGKRQNNIHYLNMFVNPNNYHIFIPKEYYEPDVLMNSSVEYIEYQPNEIIKNLIDDLIKI